VTFRVRTSPICRSTRFVPILSAPEIDSRRFG
jgi:hypothetical protein